MRGELFFVSPSTLADAAAFSFGGDIGSCVIAAENDIGSLGFALGSARGHLVFAAGGAIELFVLAPDGALRGANCHF